MSYIHKYLEDKDTPEPVHRLFSRFVEEFNKQNSDAWNNQVKQNTDEYHRKTLLKQGRCDFDRPPFNLTSAELIALYNYYYFPMHFHSSYEIFNSLFEQHVEIEDKTIFLHDYGCGTLSSAMAFGASFQKNKLHNVKNSYRQVELFQDNDGFLDNHYKYCNIDILSHLHFYTDENQFDVSSYELGVARNAGSIQYFNLPYSINGYCFNDISTSITTFLKHFLKENLFTEPYQDYFFNVADCTDSHFLFFNVADKIYVGNYSNDPIKPFRSFCNSQHKEANDIVVIVNFSYVLASESINIKNIISLIDKYQKTGCKLIVVNQNPDLDALNFKWECIKKELNCTSIINGTQAIKHFSKKSKSRFDIISFHHEDYNFLVSKLKPNDNDYNANIIEAFVIKNDIFFQKRISNILKSKEFSLALKIPRLNAETIDTFYGISNVIMYLEDNHNAIFTLCKQIKIKILTDVHFIDWFLDAISANFVTYEDLIYFLQYDSITEIPVFIRLDIWDKIFNNERLAFQFCDTSYFDGGLYYNDSKFNYRFVELAIKNNYQFIISNFDFFKYYQHKNNTIRAKYHIEQIIYSFEYDEKFKQEVITDYLKFMQTHFPNEKYHERLKVFEKSANINNLDLPF